MRSRTLVSTKLFSAFFRQKIISLTHLSRLSGSGQACRWSISAGKKPLALLIFLLAVGCTAGVSLLQASAGGGHGEEGLNWANLGWRAFNFVVLAGLLYWLLADKFRDFFTARQKDVKIALEDLDRAREEAKKKFAEYSAKLEKDTEDIENMAGLIRRQGLVEKERIIAAAQRAATKMKEDARKRVDQELQLARQELRAETVRLSVEMAEEILKKNITATDHAAMVGEYLDKVVSKH